MTTGKIEFLPESRFPGYRFCPTDQELILFYLKNKLEGFGERVDIIAEVDVIQHEPWDLPGKSKIQSNSEWFFFSPRWKRYQRGIQSRRATATGYWKATGKERTIKSGSLDIGTKRTLVFHKGRSPKWERTDWIIHEFCMKGAPQDSLVICRLHRKGEYNLDNILGPEPRDSLTGDSSTRSSVDDFQRKDVVEELTADDFEENSGLEELIADACYSPLPLDYELDQLFQGQSSYAQMDWDHPSNYFVPVMDDNILNSDEPSLTSSTDPWPQNILNDDYINVKIRQPIDAIVPSTPSSQGTAPRRIRLSKRTQGLCANPVGASIDEGDVSYSSQRTSRRTKMRKPKQIYRGDPVEPSGDESDVKYSMTSPSLNVAWVILTLLVLCVCFLSFLTWFWQRRTVVHSLGSRMFPDGLIGEGVE